MTLPVATHINYPLVPSTSRVTAREKFVVYPHAVQMNIWEVMGYPIDVINPENDSTLQLNPW